jgi:hypothetical protein
MARTFVLFLQKKIHSTLHARLTCLRNTSPPGRSWAFVASASSISDTKREDNLRPQSSEIVNRVKKTGYLPNP